MEAVEMWANARLKILCVCSGVVLVLTVVVSQSYAENNDVSPDVKKFRDDEAYRIALGEKYFASLDDYNRESWVDPYNMFDYDTENVKEDTTPHGGKLVENGDFGLSESRKPAIKDQDQISDPPGTAGMKCAFCSEMDLKPSKCNQNEYVYITRWLKKFLRKMNYSPDKNLNEVQIVRFPVVNRELHEISQFLDSKNLKDVQDLESVFDRIVEQFHISQPETRTVADMFYLLWDNSTIVLTSLLCIISLWYFHVLFRLLSWKIVVILVCCASLVWTWIHLYQKEVAKQQAKLHSSGYPEECQPISFSFRSILKHLVKATIATEDVCAKYYEAQIVDPFWKVTPLVVISESVSNFVLQPLGSIGSHCNMFLKNFYSDMSYFMMIPATFFAFIMLLMLCRYSLRLPFPFGALEPSNQASTMDRVEFLPFQNSSGHEIVPDRVQPSVHSGTEHAVHSDFNAAGDQLKMDSYHNGQKEQTTQMHLEMHELSPNISLKDQSSQTDDL